MGPVKKIVVFIESLVGFHASFGEDGAGIKIRIRLPSPLARVAKHMLYLYYGTITPKVCGKQVHP